MSVRVTPVTAESEHQAEMLRSGGVRGNYFHRHARELLVVLYTDRWTLLFDSGAGTPVETRAFSGSGAVRIEIDPLSAHAIRNDGGAELHIFVTGDPENGSIFMIDFNHRVLEIDKQTGALIQQVRARADSPNNLDQLTSLYVDASGSRPVLYMVNGGQVLRGALPDRPTPFRPASKAPAPSGTNAPGGTSAPASSTPAPTSVP